MIQSILFDKRKGWTVQKAAKWIVEHDFDLYKVDITKNFIRIRQTFPWPEAKFRISKLGDSGIDFVFMFTGPDDKSNL